ncbi:MAG TPA: 4,5-DOPA dioxygenase extradiol [Planctomycetota bacterium]|nr:4,5-DOPA dioxygenase extradiol [Planctomycetota bacterium]
MPAVFVGHGHPMNALEENAFTRGWAALGASLPRPKAVLAVSAHWYGPGIRVTAQDRPRTIHDFGGFPRELFDVRYPASGDPALARRVASLVGGRLDAGWGLDHGTWSVLRHVFPAADVPIVQLSLDDTLTAAEHWALARCVDPLRDEGVLVLGSGNVVHNLHAYAWGLEAREPYDWAVRFEQTVRRAFEEGREADLAGDEPMGPDARLSAPTPDHFLPLLYVAAVRRPGEPVSYPVEGIEGGSGSMLSIQVGA